MGLFADTPDPALLHRLDRLERKLDALLAHLDITLPEDEWHDLRELVASGKKIEAIKLYRERTGVDLATAKHAIDQMALQ